MMSVAPSLRLVLEARAVAYGAIRRTLESAGAIEVATPVACTFPDLAPMPQLKATHPRSGTVFCLRIAPEEHLTRLIARGIPAIYEISTNFRAETVDRTHLIEFQSVEAIFANRSLPATRSLVEAIFREMAAAVSSVSDAVEQVFDAEPFQVVHLPDWVEANTGHPRAHLFDPDYCRAIARDLKMSPSEGLRMDELADVIIGAVATRFQQPVFISALPNYLGGPAQEDPERPGFFNRSEIYFRGMELGSLADQLSDFGKLRARYDLNYTLRAERGITPNIINDPCLADYARGLPQYCGLGIGVDRLLMIALGVDDVRQLHPFIYD
jgi:lysyl-tRNA synthetase class II